MKTGEVRIGKNHIKIKIAESIVDRARGYMFAKKPSECEGLLFVFERKRACFWMPFVNFPLQLLFLEKDKKAGFFIVKEKYVLKPNSLREQCSKKEYGYALELAACAPVKEGQKVEMVF